MTLIAIDRVVARSFYRRHHRDAHEMHLGIVHDTIDKPCGKRTANSER